MHGKDWSESNKQLHDNNWKEPVGDVLSTDNEPQLDQRPFTYLAMAKVHPAHSVGRDRQAGFCKLVRFLLPAHGSALTSGLCARHVGIGWVPPLRFLA